MLVYGIVRTDTYGWASGRTLITLGIGALLLVGFFLYEGLVAKAPLVPLRVFKSRQLSAANFVVFMLGASAFAMWYFLSLYLQEVRGFDPIETGLAFFPMALSVVVGANLAGRGTHRFGAGPLLAIGMALICVGMLLFGRLPVHGSYVVRRPAGLAGHGGGHRPGRSCPSRSRRWPAARPRSRVLRQGSSTPPARSAARWAWPCWPRSPPSAPRTCSCTWGRRPPSPPASTAPSSGAASSPGIGALAAAILIPRVRPPARAPVGAPEPRRAPVAEPQRAKV